MTMKHSCRLLSETLRAVHRIDGFDFYDEDGCTLGSWNVDGYGWEVWLYPCTRHPRWRDNYVALKLIFLGEAGVNKLTANLSCRLLDPSGSRAPSEETVSASASFRRPSDSSTFWFMKHDDVYRSGFVRDGSLTMECAITVVKDPMGIPVPSSNLPQHLGELLENHAGADVTFAVSGESFAAHKNVLAARSPVFKAQFFGKMSEKSSGSVDVKEMEPYVFGAMLGFIYTDAVPELDQQKDAAATATLAQYLLVAADRYGLDRLKVMCERRLAFAMDTSTAATTLALAERHGCSQLKAKCIEFMAGGSREILDAVLETEGFKELQATAPTLVIELLKAAHGRKN